MRVTDSQIKDIGNQVRWILTAVAFGIWMHSGWAGFFCWFAIISLSNRD
jgi:hypothetical protein